MSTKKNLQPFFPHSANSRNEDNLIRLRIRHGAAGYGVYFMLIERLRQSENYECDYDLEVLEFDIRESENLIESVINDFDLFEIIDDGKKFHNKELTTHMRHMEEQRQKRQESARKAAAARWEAVRREEAEKLGIPYEEYIERFVKPEYFEPTSAEETDIPAPAASKDITNQNVEVSILDTEINAIQKDREWKEAIKKQYQLNDNQFRKLIDEFKESCKCEGKKKHKNIADTKSHFSRWIMKKQIKESQKSPTIKDKGKGDEAFLKATAEHIRKSDEERKKREAESLEHSKRILDNRLKIIEMGYDPEKHKIWEVMNEEWRRKNPPLKYPVVSNR